MTAPNARVRSKGTNTSSPIRKPPAQHHAPARSSSHGSLSSLGNHGSTAKSSTTRSAGVVGLVSGCGALVALLVFLRLPRSIESAGQSPEKALTITYDVVGVLTFILAIICAFGFRNLYRDRSTDTHGLPTSPSRLAFLGKTSNLVKAFQLGFTNGSIGLAYVGGFVARSSSVGITLFIPLFVNNYFVSRGLCDDSGNTPVDIKEHCSRAYTLAAVLTGVSQSVALLAAPIFGFLAERYRRFNTFSLGAAIVGIIGHSILSTFKSPMFNGDDGTPWIFVVMALIGISQIGAIVCSLGLLGRTVLELQTEHTNANDDSSGLSDNDQGGPPNEENMHLLGPRSRTGNLEHLKGSVAGIYSFSGAAGILILTKLGGYLFDRNPAAPFQMLASFNAFLLLVGIIHAILEIRGHADTSSPIEES